MTRMIHITGSETWGGGRCTPLLRMSQVPPPLPHTHTFPAKFLDPVSLGGPKLPTRSGSNYKPSAPPPHTHTHYTRNFHIVPASLNSGACPVGFGDRNPPAHPPASRSPLHYNLYVVKDPGHAPDDIHMMGPTCVGGINDVLATRKR